MASCGSVCRWVIVPMIVVCIAAITIVLFTPSLLDQPANPKPDGYWALGPEVVEKDSPPQKFTIKTEQSVLDDMFKRIDNTRWFEPLEDSRFHYGFNANYMKEVVRYWSTEFDWRKQEAILNTYQHYKMRIEGLDVHYVHVKPKEKKGIRVRPLMLIHGWPGSFFEFYKIIPMLVNPDKDSNVAFEVICPSIPGYGFSSKPMKKGFSVEDAARIFLKLMARLGHKKFYVQGGDWGSTVSTVMSQMKPSALYGVHVNFIMCSHPIQQLLNSLGGMVPFLGYSTMYPFVEKFGILLRETGYAHLQATKPDTPGFALNDSPVGLAAYILEKFSSWTNLSYIDDPDGSLTKQFSLDDLLTNVMIYWTTETIPSSMRFYKETIGLGALYTWNRVPVTVPSGFVSLPDEFAPPCPESLMTYSHRSVVQYTHMQRGGHFAAFEEPTLMAADIKKFINKVEEMMKRSTTANLN